MAAAVRGAVRELLEQTMATMDALLAASDRELAMASSHACAQGKDVWTLITNDIDHEKIHTGQVLEGRYESRIPASPMERLVAEWLAERARLIGSLIGLTDEQFNAETAPGQWTYRAVAKHVLMVEQDSLKRMSADQAAREPSKGAKSAQPSLPTPHWIQPAHLCCRARGPMTTRRGPRGRDTPSRGGPERLTAAARDFWTTSST